MVEYTRIIQVDAPYSLGLGNESSSAREFIEVRAKLDSSFKTRCNAEICYISSLRNEKFSFLAARYLHQVLTMHLTGNELYNLVKLWHSYMDFAELNTERPPSQSVIEWSTLDDCIGSLPSGALRVSFASPDRLAGFAARLIK